MKWVVHQRQACRICGSAHVRRFLHFRDMPFTDGFVSERNVGTELLAPLDIYWCPDCKVVQTQHDVEVGDYYREYRYTVSTSPFAQRYMQLLAENVFRQFSLQPGDNVIEIGSGDGYQLARFQKMGARVLGYEPSADLANASTAAGVPVVQCLFSAATTRDIPAEMQPAQVVLLTYTLDHLPEPLAFLQTVHQVLDGKRGLLIIEVHDLAKIMLRRETCLFEHEHSIYMTARTMESLLQRAGFRMLSTELVPEAQRRGNSLLIAAVRSDESSNAHPIADGQALAKLDEWRIYSDFSAAVDANHARLRAHVRRNVKAGKRIAGYGAGGRGVMTLAMTDLNQADIAYVCDRNSSFHGLLTPRSHVPVVGPDHLLVDPVGEVIVFSFGYMDEIRQQLHEFEARGGRIVSLLDVA